MNEKKDVLSLGVWHANFKKFFNSLVYIHKSELKGYCNSYLSVIENQKTMMWIMFWLNKDLT